MKFRGFRKSDALFKEAQTLVPGGVQLSRHPRMFVPGAYPIFMQEGKGSHIFDVDGNEYIDWLLSYGPIILGYQYAPLDEAVIAEIHKGFLLNLAQPVQNRLARKLIETIPCAERTIFLKTGSGATSAAIRIARAYSGKDKIIRCGFHGWHDWCYGGIGVPRNTTKDVLSFAFNDLDVLAGLLDRHASEIACVIMMPIQLDMPQDGFLQGVRELTEQHKVLLIFDEIRSGFRMAMGGAQEYFGVTPDLATFSKGIANGYPISVVVGREDIMEVVKKTFISATFFPDSMGMVAALKTIEELEKTNGLQHMWHIGEKLVSGLQSLASGMHIPAEVVGPPVMPYVLFGRKAHYGKVWGTGREELTASDKVHKTRQDRFYALMAEQGVFFHPNHHWFTCLSHTDDDVRETLSAAEYAFHRVIQEYPDRS